MTGGPDPEEGVRGRVTNKFQQSQVRPRLGGRERQGEGGRGRDPGGRAGDRARQSTPPGAPHRDRAGAGGLARVRVHCSERQPPRSVRGLPKSRLPGRGLPPARACPRPQWPLSTALTPTPRRPRGPEGTRYLCRAAVALARFSRLHAQTFPPKKPRFHATRVTSKPGARRRRRPQGKLPVQRLPRGDRSHLGADLRGRSGGLPVHRAPLILHEG